MRERREVFSSVVEREKSCAGDYFLIIAHTSLSRYKFLKRSVGEFFSLSLFFLVERRELFKFLNCRGDEV